ncbi:hypothetical protein [Luteibacter jiangsuensis]
MSREKFALVSDIAVTDLRLDPHNARIRAGTDERDCIARIVREQKSFLALMRDIAAEGLSTAPILVQPLAGGAHLVWDGNRRVTALKLLVNPELAPNAAIRAEAARLGEKYPSNVLNFVDCLSCDDEGVLFREVMKRHGGQQDGIGQRDWEAYLRSVYQLTHDHATPNKRAAQYLIWCEQQGIVVEDTFPISTLTRIAKQDHLALLGFDVLKDTLSPRFDTSVVITMAKRLVSDLQNKTISVDDVFESTQARDYIMRIRKVAGLDKPRDDHPDTAPPGNQEDEDSALERPSDRDQSPSDSEDAGAPHVSGDDEPDAGGESGSSEGKKRPGRGRSPRKTSLERPTLFVGNKPGFFVPEDAHKAISVVAELRRIKIDGASAAPIAVAMLFRALVELSKSRYMEKHGLASTGKFHNDLARAAEHMKNNGAIADEVYENIVRRTRDERDMLHANTLQQYIHSPHFHPTRDVLNAMWNDFGSVVAACWD